MKDKKKSIKAWAVVHDVESLGFSYCETKLDDGHKLFALNIYESKDEAIRAWQELTYGFKIVPIRIMY